MPPCARMVVVRWGGVEVVLLLRMMVVRLDFLPSVRLPGNLEPGDWCHVRAKLPQVALTVKRLYYPPQ